MKDFLCVSSSFHEFKVKNNNKYFKNLAQLKQFGHGFVLM